MTTNASTRSLPLAVAAIALLGTGAIAWFFLGGGTSAPEPKPVPPPVAEAPLPVPEDMGPQPASAIVEVQTPDAAGVPSEDCIAYPDGSRLPPLNGVTKAPRIAFHRYIPFSKILGRRTDARGVEWYVHENGAMSTTRYQMRDGKREAVGELMMPAEVKGVVDK